MRNLFFILISGLILMGCASKKEVTSTGDDSYSNTEDYWEDTDTAVASADTTKKHRRQDPIKQHCYCPAQEGEGFLSHAGRNSVDLLRDQVRMAETELHKEGVGELQKITPEGTQVIATGLFASISYFVGKLINPKKQKVYNSTRKKDPAMTGAACECNPCAIHGQRYRPTN